MCFGWYRPSKCSGCGANSFKGGLLVSSFPIVAEIGVNLQNNYIVWSLDFRSAA